MPTIDDLIKDFEYLIDDIDNKAELAADAATNAIILSLEVNVPVGKFGNTEWLQDAMLASSGVRKTGNSYVSGVSSIDMLGDPGTSAPSGTIADFLEWWKVTYPDRAHEGHRPKSRDKSRAWWDLSSDQKEKLEAQRAQGRFGGIPNKAPYWWVQEAGNTSAGIPPSMYLKDAREMMEPLIEEVVRQIING